MKLSREEIKVRARRMASIMEPSAEELETLKKIKLLQELSNQLMEIGYFCMTNGREIISIIDRFSVDTSKLSIPNNDYEKFRASVLAGDYDMVYAGELVQTEEMKNSIDDAVKSRKAHIMY